MNDVRRKIIELANEDYYALWEIVWAVREIVNGDLEEGQRIAREHVIELISNGRIHLYEDEDNVMRALTPNKAIDILTHDDVWREPATRPGPVFRVATAIN